MIAIFQTESLPINDDSDLSAQLRASENSIHLARLVRAHLLILDAGNSAYLAGTVSVIVSGLWPYSNPSNHLPITRQVIACIRHMTERDDAYLLFKALADPSRRKLLDLLHAHDGRTLNDLCEHLDMTRQGVTQHLDLLEAANLVATVRGGAAKSCTSSIRYHCR